MATKERIKKKFTSSSPAVRRKSSSSSKASSKISKQQQLEEPVVDPVKDPVEADPQGSQVSVRSATNENIKDNTVHDKHSPEQEDDSFPSPQTSSASPRPSSSETKKTKKDHIDEKLGKEKSSLVPPGERKRSASPIRKNNVSPSPEEKGSMVSLRSNISRTSKEAWVERNEQEKETRPSSSKHKSSSSVVSLQESQIKGQKDGLLGIKAEAEEDSPEKHAYIPYLYARNCIAKIMEDMKAMKTNHIVIVENIQHHYTSIESETQEQFNMFVICMKEDYANKRKTFRGMIDKLKIETENKEKYWNELLTSLAERNNRLLREKKTILIKSKTEIERLEKEKADANKEWSGKMDKMTIGPAPVPVTQWEEEKKILEDQLQSEKMAVAALEKELEAAQRSVSPTSPTKEVAKVVTKENAASGGGILGGGMAVGAMAITAENNKKMEKERREMEEERQRLSEEREKLEAEREGFGGERKKWMDEIAILQTQLGQRDVEGNEWKTKHDILHERLQEVADVQAKYLLLENQYAALSGLVKNSDTSASVQEELEKTKAEKEMMNEERAKLEKDIKKWEADFEKKHKRKPTEDDKSDSVQEMYTTYSEVHTMVTSLEQKESTYKQVEAGQVPEAPEISHKPVDTRDPEVVTVQVKVPDPTIVHELERTQEEITITRTEVTTLQQEVSNLRSEISKQNEELSKQRTTITELEVQIQTMKAGGATTGAVAMATAGSGVSDEEMEKLKKENRELKRDMKKMIKQYERLAQRRQEEGGQGDDEGSDLSEKIGQLDNKIADLESENEALKEERLILREKVRTITETITITHGEEGKKAAEEKDRKIDELLKELEEMRQERTEMQKDIMKMVKSHAKSKARMEELKAAEKAVKLLEVVAMLIHQIHGEVPDAATKVSTRLDDVEDQTAAAQTLLDTRQAAYQEWVDQYTEKHGMPPGKEDGHRQAERLVADWEIAKRDYKEKHLTMSALKIIQTGDARHGEVKSENTASKAEIEAANLERALAAADEKLIDLESNNQTLLADRDKHRDKVQELERELEEMRQRSEVQAVVMADAESSAELTQQLSELQKKSDGFEAELMQERLSHVNTRDELETLRKQLEVVREEMENERQGVEARLVSVRAGMEAQLEDKQQELRSVQERNEVLEAERLSKLPPDTAAEIKQLQDKLKELEKDKSSNKSSSVILSTQLAELTSKLETANKNLETQRASNREMEAKLKSNRMEKDKETKRVSKHIEEKNQKAAAEDKQRIAMLVKRIKELESQVGKGKAVVPVAAVGGDKGGDGQVHILKREVKDQAAKIKQLEKELRLGGTATPGGKEAATDKQKTLKHEKILKELDKRLEHEKAKSEQLVAGLKAADDENKELKKEVDEKAKALVKVSAELKTLSLAAKEGVEAATKVKELESNNKHLRDENAILTKNFESERVLRKKYYNMVEDMKGKIRVYCRARPLSSSELNRGNKSVLRSADEYSVAVDTSRGTKEFQYDAVFMQDSTQEKIFEDTNNLIQSAVDGYNVCIFAYGQTGSGKTFTMIGDREQKFPGIAPRAFTRIFDLVDELKDKFTITVEAYMMELYNEKLIDLFAKPGNADDTSEKIPSRWLELLEEEKLEIKKDKKGMVFVQGAIIKKARNAKELFALFEEGSTNRHTASTKMNAESSRSHLVIGIIMESTNKNTGNITKGKLSLVDLAGSERVAKTQAGAEQLKEAMSINKSLSALGDVISALSSEQQFIPYRNNKLTMLMQDSLGGNAKTLMFVNISPADYNMDETVISLTYASRVKLITNDASKNSDNKEIARLKNVIAKLKKGEQVEEEDV